MKIATLHDLYIDQLQDMHSAESQLIKALPKMAKAASHPKLREAFTNHLEETKEHLERVQGLLADLDAKPGRKKCEAMAGLVKEGAEIISDDADESVRDAGLIVAAQKVEHYEIASYGCLRTFATLLGHTGQARVLAQTLEEEKGADKLLTRLATTAINVEAMA